ncbi:hypothetical protein FRB97_004801 [Tulasnella sp. 331]|nr:hypothetical protein FRB97_004801 [Tulasnella sp. 331]
MRSQRDAYRKLAERAVKLVLILAEGLANGAQDSNFQSRIEEFSEELQSIYASIRPFTKYKWYRHYWEMTRINNTINDGIARLEACSGNFQVVGILELHKMLESTTKAQREASEFQGAILRRQEEIGAAVQSVDRAVRAIPAMIEPAIEETPVFSQLDIEWEACLDQTPGPSYFRLCSAVLINRVGQPRVLIKTYPSAYDEEVRFLLLQGLRHPNVPNLIGRSAKHAAAPFAVFSEGIEPTQGSAAFLMLIPVEGFMVALSIMQGVASAIQYMCGDMKLGTKDLKHCMEMGNLTLSRSGKVVVGRDLILSGPTTSYSLDLSKWLMRHFWCLTNQVLYGNDEGIDDWDWNSLRSKLNTHVHSLSTLVAYDCPNFTYMTKRLASILHPLNALKRSSNHGLTYSDIRARLLRAPLAHLCFVYRPLEAIDVSLGDIGYMKGKSFIRLANIQEDVDFLTVVNGNVEYVHSAPPDIQMERLGGGIINNVVRQGDAEHIDDIPSLWPYFIRRAPALVSGIKGLRPEDLILIASIQKGWRGTRLECKPDGHLNPSAPFAADFIEPRELPEGREWGTWVVDGFEIKDSTRKIETEWTMTPNGHCVKMKMTRYAQRIEFMQLSQSDYTPIENVTD